jgi:hypothetical protein
LYKYNFKGIILSNHVLIIHKINIAWYLLIKH